MRDKLFRKALFLAIIVLFVGTSVTPSIYGVKIGNSELENEDIGNAALYPKAYQRSISESIDLAVVNAGNSDVSVLLNDGSGGFEDREDYPVGDYPEGIVAGDFNSDSFLDLAIANLAGSISILLNDGSGGFEDRQDYSVGYWVLDIVAGDFNSDSFLDLAVTNAVDDDISVLLNDGSGGFEYREDYQVGASPWGIFAGDFNSDNILDLAVTNENDDDISILLNDGSGGFKDRQDYPVGNRPSGIIAGDFNSDSFLDLAVTNAAAADISVLLNDGSGGFKDRQDYPVGGGPWGIIAGDFNSDSFLDLAITNRWDDDISIYLNDGSGGFEDREDYPAGNAPDSIAAEDFNSDSFLDLAVTNCENYYISVLMGDGSGGFEDRVDYPVGKYPEGIAAGDFDTSVGNQPPTIQITYPNQGQTVSGTITISGTADDSDGTVSYVQVKIDTGDWQIVSGTTPWIHDWDTKTVPNGQHAISARSFDGQDYSQIDSVDVIVNNAENQPPNAPIIDGPPRGSAYNPYTYKFTSTDPEEDDVSYYIKWGDGEITYWTAFQASGSPGYSESHTWDKQDEYTIEVKAKDIYGAESEWATLKVTMPRNRAITSPFLNFLQNHPYLFPILRHLLRL
jgi:hypothetical protein